MPRHRGSHLTWPARDLTPHGGVRASLAAAEPELPGTIPVAMNLRHRRGDARLGGRALDSAKRQAARLAVSRFSNPLPCPA